MKSQNHLLNKKSKVSIPPEAERVSTKPNTANSERQSTYDVSQQNAAKDTNQANNNQAGFFPDYQSLVENYATPEKLTVLITSLLVLSCLSLLGYQFFFNNVKTTRVESGINFINGELWKINSAPILNVPAKSRETFVKRKFKNKLLLLNTKTSRIYADFHNKLSDENKPKSLDEVQTFVWIDCDTGNDVGIYTDRSTAYTMRCDLTAIDKAEITAIGKQYFITYPPNSVRQRQSRVGEIPYERIITYLKENTEQ